MKSTEDVTYDAPPPVAFETSEARFHLADAKLACYMKVHFAAEVEARTVVEPILRAWEVNAGLRQGRAEVQFQFESSELIDRTPVTPGTVGVPSAQLRLIAHAPTVATLTKHITRRTYPAPPGDFRITPNVETLWHRYEGYRSDREPLLSMAYFCLTVLEALARGRVKAAAMYKIDKSVLDTLGKLTSIRGDPSTARKMKTQAMRALSGAESVWIEAAIKQIIWRTGDQRPLAKLPTITMTDLPPL
jgi:hypothetical protein